MTDSPHRHRFRARPFPVESGSCGFFDLIPFELVFEIFDFLPLADIGTLALASEGLRVLVSRWIPTSRCLSRALETNPSRGHKRSLRGAASGARGRCQRCRTSGPSGDSRRVDLDEDELGWEVVGSGSLGKQPRLNPFAVLCKRMTCLLSTKERIRFALRMFDPVLLSKHSFVRNRRGAPLVFGAEGGRRKKVFRSNNHFHPYRRQEPSYREGHHGAGRAPPGALIVGSPPSENGEGDRLRVCPDSGHRRKLALHTVQFITMLHTFIRGWDESEFPLLLAEIDRKFDLTKDLHQFMACRSREDACLSAETDLRLFLRCLSWDFAGNDYGHRAAWLLTMMKCLVQHVPNSQTMLFMLMFGPGCRDRQRPNNNNNNVDFAEDSYKMAMNELNNHTNWDSFCSNVPRDFHEGKAMFFSLAQAICSCLSASPHWKQTMACSVVDEMFRIPQAWRRENVAGFLLFCSEALISHYLQGKIDSGSKQEVQLVGKLLIDMILVSHKFNNELAASKGIGKVFHLICQYPKEEQTRKVLFDAIWDTIMTEVEERELDLEEDDVYDNLRNFGIYIMQRVYAQQRGVTGPPSDTDRNNTAETDEADTDIDASGSEEGGSGGGGKSGNPNREQLSEE